MAENFLNLRENNQNLNNSQSTQSSEKLENVFMRVDTTFQLKEGGGQSQILFVNNKQKKYRSEEKEKLQNNFVSDGGLKEKSMKYYDSTTFNKLNLPQKKSQSLKVKFDPNTNYNQMTTYNVNVVTQRTDSNENTKSNEGNSSTVKVLFNRTKPNSTSANKNNIKQNYNSNNKTQINERKSHISLAKSLQDKQKERKKYSEQIKLPVTKKSNQEEKREKLSENNIEKVTENSQLREESRNKITQNSEEKVLINKKMNRKIVSSKKKDVNNLSNNSLNEDRPKRNSFLTEDKKSFENQSQNKSNKEDISQNKSEITDQEINITNNKSKYNPIKTNLSNKSKSKEHFAMDTSKSKTKLCKSKEKEIKILSAEEKMELMEKLVKNKEDEIIKDVQKEVIKKGKQANEKIQRKLKYLSENNMLDNINLDLDEDKEDFNEDFNMEDGKDSQEENNIIKQNTTLKKPRENNFMSNTTIRSKSSPNQVQKKILKPKVDSLEFFVNIINERKNDCEEDENEIENEKDNTEIQNSFRKAHSEERSKVIESDDYNYKFSQKANKREREEIHEFIKIKREKVREEARKLEEEKLEGNMNKYKELSKVFENQRNAIKNAMKKSQSFNSRKSVNLKKSKRFRSMSSSKVKNEMFIGKSKLAKKSLNESSFIDADDYYLSALESKMILTPAYNRINTVNRENTNNSINNMDVKESEETQYMVINTGKREEIDTNSDANINTVNPQLGFNTVSKLSNFTNNPRMNFGEDIFKIDDKHVFKSQTKEEFLKFIEQKEKEVTIRSLDSNDLISVKSRDNKSDTINTGGFTHNQESIRVINDIQASHDKPKSRLEEVKAKVNDINQKSEHFTKNGITTEEIIKTQTSKKISESIINYRDSENDNPILTQNEEINYDHSVMEQLATIPSRKSNHSKINKEDLNKFANLIKNANRKQVFYSLLESAQLNMLMQHYDYAFQYMQELDEVILSRNVILAFQMLKEYSIVKNYYDAFNFFSIPTKRFAFNQIRNHAYTNYNSTDIANLNNSDEVRECEKYLNLITKFAKRDAFNQLKEYVINKELNEYEEDEEKLIELYIQGFNMFVNPWKRDAFYRIAKHAFEINSRENTGNNSYKSNNSNQAESVILHVDKSPSRSQLWYKEEENVSPNLSNDKNVSDDIQVINLDKSKRSEKSSDKRLNLSLKSIKSSQRSQNNISQNNLSYNNYSQNNMSQNNMSQNNMSQNNMSQNNYSQNNLSQNNMSQNNISANNSNYKMHTFMYESYSDNSSIAVYPNSFESPKLHRLHELIEKQKMERSSNNESPGTCNYGNVDNSYPSKSNEKNLDLNKSNNSSSIPIQIEEKSQNSFDKNSLKDDTYVKDNLSDNNISNNNFNNVDLEPKKIENNLTEEVIEEMIQVTNPNEPETNTKVAVPTELDISADKDNTSDIDWIHTISNSKSSGSFRDQIVNFNNANNKFNLLENESQNRSMTQITNKKVVIIPEENSGSIERQFTDEERNDNLLPVDTNVVPADLNLNKIIIENKNDEFVESEENYDDFVEEVIEIEKSIDEKNILEIISDDKEDLPVFTPSNSSSPKNDDHVSISNQNINENDAAGNSVPSIKSRNTQGEKKKIDDKNLLNISENINHSIQNTDNLIQDLKDKSESNPTEIYINRDKNINSLFSKDHSENEAEIIFDENYINKITIESVDINFKENVIPQLIKDKQSIESNDSPGFFIENNNNDIKERNLLDTVSYTNKSNVTCDNDKDLLTNRNIEVKEINENKNTISSDRNIFKFNENLLDENKSERKTNRSQDYDEKIKNLDLNNLADDITNKILEELLMNEIRDDLRPLIPKKQFKNERENLVALNLSNNLSTSQEIKNLNDSQYSTNSAANSLNNSIFLKTIIDYKKETSLNLYSEKIAPKLIQKIGEKVSTNYIEILNVISTPYQHKPSELINALVNREQNKLKKAYKVLPEGIENNQILDKKIILNDFEKFNKTIREDDNITSDNYYDNILNECMVDASNEVLKKERHYGQLGEPLPWSNRTRTVTNKYNQSEYSKNNLKKHLETELTQMVNYKMGLIAENNDYLDLDQLNVEREKRLMTNIIKEVNLKFNFF